MNKGAITSSVRCIVPQIEVLRFCHNNQLMVSMFSDCLFWLGSFAFPVRASKSLSSPNCKTSTLSPHPLNASGPQPVLGETRSNLAPSPCKPCLPMKPAIHRNLHRSPILFPLMVLGLHFATLAKGARSLAGQVLLCWCTILCCLVPLRPPSSLAPQ